MWQPNIKTVLIRATRKWGGYLTLSVLGWLILCGNACSYDLGVIGSIYEIKERNALDTIYEKLYELKNNGEIERIQTKLKEKVVHSIHHPKPAGIIRTTTPKTFEKDLTITVPHDIKTHEGQIIHKAGTRLNPLTKIPTQKSLLFLNGEDPEQIIWGLNEYQKRLAVAKLVLINGPVIDLMNQHEVPFYFDQHGKLTHYFNIQHVPAIVEQVGDKLRISEVLP